MKKCISKIIGLKKSEFDEFVKSGDVQVRRASLIPTTKVGDEMGLTSVLLSSIRLIKEFRSLVLTDLKMMKSGHLHVYTEVVFSDFPESRIDGMILIVHGGVIKDAAFLEMKKGSNNIELEQIEKYLDVARKYNIPRLVTVSNEFVAEPTQFPLDIKTNKSVNLYHLSWSYLLTLSHILLFKNDNNILDEDQVEIMKEVVNYFKFDKSGVSGFHQMKKGWTTTVENINSKTSIKAGDGDVQEAVLSWQQEERDLTLVLSQRLGVLVKCGESKYKGNYKQRVDDDTKKLVNNKKLHSVYHINGAVSEIKTVAFFENRAIEISVTLKAPTEKTLRGQIGWINKQFETCSKKNPDIFSQISNEILLEVYLKNTTKPLRISLANLGNLSGELKDKKIRECKIIHLKDFGKMFASKIKFIDTIERMVLDFYSGIVENLRKWEPSAPKLAKADSVLEEVKSVDFVPVYRKVEHTNLLLTHNTEPVTNESEFESDEFKKIAS